MNGARLGIAAQSVGLSQAAYNEGLAYAKDRKQFGKAIIEFPAVYDMLAIMKGKLDAGRALLYQTARYVDIYKALDDISRERKLTPEERQEQKKYAKLADSFSILVHQFASRRTVDTEFVFDTTYVHTTLILVIDEHRKTTTVSCTFFRTSQYQVKISITVCNKTFYTVQQLIAKKTVAGC